MKLNTLINPSLFGKLKTAPYRLMTSGSSSTGNNFRLTKNLHCFRNNQCWSGYCNKGRCEFATKEHDPCRPSIENCPPTLQCSTFSHTCISPSYRKLIPCQYGSDCSFKEICLEGQCTKIIPLGRTCNSLRPDLCATGSKCTSLNVNDSNLRCYEFCSDKVTCPEGYNCIENVYNPDSVCLPIPSKPSNRFTQFRSSETLTIVLIIFFILIILLGGLYGWIRLTGSKKDPRLIKRKKKKLRLNYDGNGLATLTIVPSKSQLSQPVAASQIFLNNNSSNLNDGPPPAYSEIINMSQ